MESGRARLLESIAFDRFAIGIEFNDPLLGTVEDAPGLPDELEPVLVAFDGVFESDFT